MADFLFAPTKKQLKRRAAKQALEDAREAKRIPKPDKAASGDVSLAAKLAAAVTVEGAARVVLDARRIGDEKTRAAATARLGMQLKSTSKNETCGSLCRAAQWLALAGVADPEVFAALAAAVAAAPVPAAAAAAEAAAALGVADVTGLGVAGGAPLAFHDAAPLSALWEYSASLAKCRKPVSPANDAPDWPPAFADPTLPLAIDLGCGFGASSVALAAAAAAGALNVLGCDRAFYALDYARGLAARRGLSGRCVFAKADASEVLRWVREAYKGPVTWCLLQFPTPYALDDGKNKQLPPSATSGRFMANDALLKLVLEVLAVDGQIVHTSNVEDVAVTVRASLERLGGDRLAAVSDGAGAGAGDGAGPPKKRKGKAKAKAAAAAEEAEAELPKRTARWIAQGGARAQGTGWLRASVLPATVRTETEAYYEAAKKPVHRCAFKVTRAAEKKGGGKAVAAAAAAAAAGAKKAKSKAAPGPAKKAAKKGGGGKASKKRKAV